MSIILGYVLYPPKRVYEFTLITTHLVQDQQIAAEPCPLECKVGERERQRQRHPPLLPPRQLAHGPPEPVPPRPLRAEAGGRTGDNEPSVIQSVIQSVSPSVSQSVSQSVRQSISQSVTIG